MEYYSYENPMPWLIDTDYKALRTERYKYIHWYKHENKNELYDLVNDPFEMKNLVNETNMREIKKELENALAVEAAKVFGLVSQSPQIFLLKYLPPPTIFAA